MCCVVCTKVILKCQMFMAKVLTLLLIVICLTARATEIVEMRQPRQGTYAIGSCKIVINEPCPYSDIKFYLYTRKQPDFPQPLLVGNSTSNSNLTKTDFDHRLPSKIIIHGYNSDMFLSALVEIKRQYLSYNSYNIFAVDWAALAPSPCYLSAKYNIQQVGKCTAQLLDRLRDIGATDIHVIGFSLGAHVTNYVANSLKPYKLPRITGLDPAMPGFTFVSKDHKLDAGDARFVDVIHTNAFLQGTIQSSGHVDFYMNGGVIQPGCWAENHTYHGLVVQGFFACNHHRAPLYFAESISSTTGFWGWPCRNYFMYLIGMCPPVEPQILAGEHVNTSAEGMHLVITGSVSPFAVGKFTGPAIEIFKNKTEEQRKEMFRQYINKYKEEVREEFIDDEDLIDIFTQQNRLGDDIKVEQIW